MSRTHPPVSDREATLLLLSRANIVAVHDYGEI